MTPDAKNVTGNLYAVYPSVIDNILLFALVLLTIGVVVSVFLLDTHPIFIFVSFVLLLSVFGAILLLANIYDDIASDPTISAYAGAFPYTNWIMTHFLTVMLTIGFIILIALFLKLRR